MKFTRKNAGLGMRALLAQLYRPSFLRHLAAKAMQEAYYEGARSGSSIPAIAVKDPRIGTGDEVTLKFDAKAGNTSILEQYILISIAKKYRLQRFFEIGTFDGQTAWMLAKNLPSLQVFTLDLPAEASSNTALPISQGERRYIDKPVIGKQFLGTPEAARITQLLGDSATFDYAPYRGTMDAVFIDGCHDEEYVRSDTEKALTLLGKRGMLLWHDYLTYDSVTRPLETLGKTMPLLHIQGTSLVVHFKGM